jgi:hypothetical protein
MHICDVILGDGGSDFIIIIIIIIIDAASIARGLALNGNGFFRPV